MKNIPFITTYVQLKKMMPASIKPVWLDHSVGWVGSDLIDNVIVYSMKSNIVVLWITGLICSVTELGSQIALNSNHFFPIEIISESELSLSSRQNIVDSSIEFLFNIYTYKMWTWVPAQSLNNS